MHILSMYIVINIMLCIHVTIFQQFQEVVNSNITLREIEARIVMKIIRLQNFRLRR